MQRTATLAYSSFQANGHNVAGGSSHGFTALQHNAIHCNTRQHSRIFPLQANGHNVAGGSSRGFTALQHTATHGDTLVFFLTGEWPRCCGGLPRAALPHCNTLQNTATHCKTLQYAATLTYSSLQANGHNVAGGSSRGFTMDDRIKPDLVAPGDKRL